MELSSKEQRGIQVGCLSFAILFALYICYGLFTDKPASKTLPAEPLTEAEKLKFGCKALRRQYSRKPISELTLAEVDNLRTCEALGF